MFCKNCGKQLEDYAAFCPDCGTSTRGQSSVNSQPQQQPQYWAQPQNQYQQQRNGYNENSIAIIGFVFAFLFPLVGLICSIIGYKNSKNGGANGGLALAGIIISAIWFVLIIIIIVVVASAAAAAVSTVPQYHYYY